MGLFANVGPTHSLATGVPAWCREVPLEPYDQEPVGGTNPGTGTIPTTRVCANVSWPAQHLWMTHRQRPGAPAGSDSWWGSLIENKRDLTGQLYMRNRYYDPQAGRFTQEDPIGLAGGLNAYGFAAGDPISYGDPYGLSACPIEWGGDGATPYLSDCPRGTVGFDEWRRLAIGAVEERPEHIMILSGALAQGARALLGPLFRSIGSYVADQRESAGPSQSGLPAHVQNTLNHIRRRGSAPSGYKGGSVFRNDGRAGGQALPRQDAAGNPIQYREWDVHPYTKGVNRGAERIVTGSDGSAYYTANHYHTFTPVQ